MAEAADLRPARGSDAAGIAAVYRAYVLDTVASFEEQPPDATEIARRMADRPRLPWWVAVRGSTVVGHCYAAHYRSRPAYRWSVDCSVYVAASEQRRGTGRRLYDVLLPELRTLGYVTACAGIVLPNPASVALHEALGFRPIGVDRDIGFKHGSWHDVGRWQLALRPPPVEPVEPADWSPAVDG